MYQEEYKRWLAADLQDADLNPELSKIEGNDEEIKDRFAVALKFGTAGLRGVLGAGTNRMNIYVVRQATQGLANWVKTQGGNQTVAISYDSRLKSDVFAKTAAGVLAANDINVRIYDALMPVPALSFATRYYECNAGIMVTASHNPAKYNGYKAYGPDGCQMTDDAAAIVYEEIQKTDVLTGAKYMSFAEGVEQGKIRFVGDDCKQALYEAIESRQVRPGLCKTAGLKLVYSPLNGSGLVPVTQVLKDIGITDITIVPEQEYPNGYFTTCSYPNPEIFAALELGLNLAKETGADLMLATDPDADRVGIAMKCPDGSYELVTGNEVGVLLLDAGADGVEAVLKLLAVAQLIAADTVNGAHNHEDHHDQHDDGVDVQSGNPGFDTLSKNTGVSSCDQFAKIHYLHSFSNSQNSLGVEGLSSLCAYSRDWNTCCAGRGMTEVPTSSSASRDAAATASRTAPTSPVRVTKPLPPMAYPMRTSIRVTLAALAAISAAVMAEAME